jgi:hypothetical protein
MKMVTTIPEWVQLCQARKTVETQLGSIWEQLGSVNTSLLDAASSVDKCYTKDGKPEGYAVDVAEAAIRLFALCDHFDIDLDYYMRLKLAYNEEQYKLRY